MDFIKNFLMNKKYYESIDEVEQLLIAKDIDQNSIIQSLMFDKTIFPTEEDVRLWIREHGFSVESVGAKGEKFIVLQLDPSEFVDTSFRNINIRTGISAVVAVLKQDAVEGGLNDIYFSLRNSDRSIKLTDNTPHIIELAKVVSGVHANYGKVEITKEMLESFVRNFNERVVGVDVMIDFDHEQRGAAGWVKSIFTSIDGTTLFGEVRWTPKGAQCLSDREFRYFSPEFTLNYVHPHTGVSHGPTLIGGGLVNRPFLKMGAIVTFKDKQTNEVLMDTIALKEHNAIKLELEKTISDLRLSEAAAKNLIEGMKTENVKLSTELNDLKLAKEKSEKESKHQALFSEGKISAAQLKALNEGKDLYEVLSLSAKLNTEPNGKDGNSDVQLSEADERACKALGVSKEDYLKYN